jgi:hypothetical protein
MNLDKYMVMGNIPYSYWNVKNVAEMKQWIVNHHGAHFPDAFLDELAKLEMQNLISLKLQRMQVKDKLHSA